MARCSYMEPNLSVLLFDRRKEKYVINFEKRIKDPGAMSKLLSCNTW